MSRALPFTQASLARAIKGVELAGRFVIGMRVGDGTLIIGDKPVDVTSLLPVIEQDAPTPVRRFGEKLNGGHGAT